MNARAAWVAIFVLGGLALASFGCSFAGTGAGAGVLADGGTDDALGADVKQSPEPSD